MSEESGEGEEEKVTISGPRRDQIVICTLY